MLQSKAGALIITVVIRMSLRTPNFWKIGHRGAAGYEPENTFRSFEKALELGADAIEFDVQKTKDGKLVIIHDETVDRTTNGKGSLNNFTLKELWRFDAGKGEMIPEFADVLCCFGKRTFLHIELKENGLIEQTLRLINIYDCLDSVIVSAFSSLWPDLFLLKSKEPKLKIALAVGAEADVESASELACEKDIFSINASFKATLKIKSNPNFIPKKSLIFSWTCDDLDQINKVKSLGVNGIFSNYPDRL